VSHGLVAAAALVLVAVAPTPCSAQIEVETLELTLGVEPERRSGTFLIRNRGQTDIPLTIDFGDWDRDVTGSNRWYALGTTPGSCGDAFEVFPSSIRVPAGGEQTVRVSLRNGVESRVCWGAVYVVTPPQQAPSGGGVRMEMVVRTAVKLYLEPRGLSAAVDLDDVRFVADTAFNDPRSGERERGAVVANLRSVGALQARITGTFEVRTGDNRIVLARAFEDVYVLPSAARTIAFPTTALSPGRYVGLLVMRYGGAEDIAAQVLIDIPPS